MSVRRPLVALAGATMLLVAACGGGENAVPTGDSPAAPPDTASSGSSTPSPPTAESGQDLSEGAVVSVDEAAAAGEVRALVRQVEVGETVRYAGFDVEVTDVAFGFDPGGFPVAYVSTILTNHTTRAERLQTAVEIESQGFVAVVDRDMSPEVPAGGTADGAFSLRLDPSFTFGDAILFIGRPDRPRAQIPLGEVGELVTRAPETFTDLGANGDPVSTITIDAVTVSWDSTDPRGQAALGMAYLHVDYTLNSTVETAVNDDTIALVDGNGAVISAATASIGAIEEPTQLTASFLVVDPPDGDYVLRYTERFGNGAVDVAFSIG